MDQETIVHQAGDALVAFVPGLNLLASTTGTAQLPASPASPAIKTTSEIAEAGIMAKWGSDNKRPFDLIAAVNSNAVLSQGIYWKSNAISSGGLAYGVVEINETTGKPRLRRVIDPRVELFLRRSNVNRYLREATHEFFKFWNVFAELVLTNDRSEIASISCHETAYCRWGVQNAKGLIDKCYINANFDTTGKWDSPETLVRPVVDPYYDPVTAVRAQPMLASFIYPLSGTSSGLTYYPRAPWESVLDQGWVDVANRTVKTKLAILKNQMTVKYQLEVHEFWFQAKYSDWDTKPALKAQRMKGELDAFNAKMKGEDAAGNSLINMKKIIGEKEYSGWSIRAIDDKLQDGRGIEDSQEATSQILFALGIDGTLIGSVPGRGNSGGGSGSDKRVAMNIATANSKPEQDIILEPLQFIFEFNGYVDPKTGLPYTVWFENYWITTLDTGKEITGKPLPGAL